MPLTQVPACRADGLLNTHCGFSCKLATQLEFAMLALKNKVAFKLGLSTNRLEVSHLLLSEQLHCRGGLVLTSKGGGEVL